MNLICENYTYQLGDACEYQVGVKCILVLGFTSGQTEAVFYVIDRPLHICPGFVGLVPFVSPPHNAWIGTEIFLRISVNHPAAGRCGTWVIAMTNPLVFTGVRVLLPFDFWTHKFVSCNTAFEFGCAFIFHWKCFVVWTAGNAIGIQWIVRIFESSS